MAEAAEDAPVGMRVQKFRKDEDRVCSMTVQIGDEAVLLLCVADGHGGKEAADFCKEWSFQYLITEARDDARRALC